MSQAGLSATGIARLKLYRGNLIVAARKSPNSLDKRKLGVMLRPV
jgi:argininosuccinate synthase